MRVIICDDEELALERLRHLLCRIEGVEVTGAALSGGAALDLIEATRPDAVYLDVEMPLLDGFDVIEAIVRADNIAPLVVFVTAFPKFATNAFDTGAIDFLTKPVRLGRLKQSVARVRSALDGLDAKRRLGELAGQLDTLRAGRAQDSDAGRYLWVQSRGTASRLDLDSLDLLKAEGEYVRLYVGESSYLHREPIRSLVPRLNPHRYVQVHRSYAVDRSKVVNIIRRATGSYHLVLSDGKRIPVARSRRRLIREFLDGGS